MADDDTIRLIWPVELVCARPHFYTPTSTLEEVLCLLSGFYGGMVVPEAGPEQRKRALREWYGFLGVLPTSSSVPMCEWHTLYQRLRADFADDAAALAHLAELYHAYRSRVEGEASDLAP